MKIVLHIGTEKTGTTSIQQALAQSRDALAASGILFPKLFGSQNHMEIAVANRQGEARDELQVIELEKFGSNDISLYRQRLQEKLIEEAQSGKFNRIVISNEHCHSRLVTDASVEALARFFEPITSHVDTLVYLRRQDRAAVSLDSTRVKLGGSGELFPSSQMWTSSYFDYDTMIKRYQKVFGLNSITVRLYEKSMLKNEDVVDDFFQVARIGQPPDADFVANASLSRAQSVFLTEFNKEFPLIREGKLNPERGPIVNAIARVGLGAPYRPQRDQAMAFYEKFRDGNARIKQQFFSNIGRQTLFDEDFQEYPETATDAELSRKELFEFIAAIWRFKLKQ